MPSLDSPIVTLGALFLAGNSAPEFTGGETGRGLVAGGFGGASAEWLGTQVNNLAGGNLPVSTHLGQALAGAAISRWGDPIPQNNAIARGIHYNTATQMAQELGLSAGDLFGDFMGGGSGGSSGGSNTSATVTSVPSAGSSPSATGHRNTGGSGTKVY